MIDLINLENEYKESKDMYDKIGKNFMCLSEYSKSKDFNTLSKKQQKYIECQIEHMAELIIEFNSYIIYLEFRMKEYKNNVD